MKLTLLDLKPMPPTATAIDKLYRLSIIVYLLSYRLYFDFWLLHKFTDLLCTNKEFTRVHQVNKSNVQRHVRDNEALANINIRVD